MAKNKDVRRRAATAEREERAASKSKVKRRPARNGKDDGADFGNWPYAVGRMDPCAKILGLAILIGTLSLIGYYRYQEYLKELVRTPLNSPKMLNSSRSPPLVDPEKFWGTYRSQAYFGLKTRGPRSPLVGMLWLTEFTGHMPPQVRHWCDQGDGLPRYGWLRHDGVHFGAQEIEEKTYTILTEFVKRPGGFHGGDWTARMRLLPKNTDSAVVVSLMFYIALDGQGYLEPVVVKNRLKSVTGFTEDLGNFQLYFLKPTSPAQKFNYLVTYTSRLDRLKEVTIGSMKMDTWDEGRTMPYFSLTGRSVPQNSEGGPNFMVHQVTAKLPLEMEVLFESGSFQNRRDTLRGNVFSQELQRHSREFDARFSRIFQLEQKGYKEDKINFAKSALSNMLGSIGYFYGSSLVQSKYNPEPVQYWRAPLYTAVPSRSFFPRGFLWDEGFHNLLIAQWDQKISKDIISHWLDLINVEGWIPREQILGVEARAKVPQEFVVQWNTNANPPTLFLPLQFLIRQIVNSSKPEDHAFLQAVFPRLKAWYSFYNTTQRGNQFSSYRWRGRDPLVKRELNPKTLTSGLDDYPRASHPTDDERHIDLRCWMALASNVMYEVAKSLQMDGRDYEASYNILTDNQLLDTLHWSEKTQQYGDYGLHSAKVRLERPKPPVKQHPSQQPPPQLEKIRVVTEEPKYQFVNSFGYVSLFPFLLKIIQPDSPKLFKILTDLKDPGLLWSNFGLRSLAKSAPFYNRYNTEHDPPYWRGAIWININYLALGALHHYSVIIGPYQNVAQVLYHDLRENVINNIFKEYQETGYIWEQYNDKSGKGKGSHPFTGWSALVVLMMAEKY